MADLPPTKRKWSLKKKLAIFVLLPFLVLLGSLLIFDVWGGTKLNQARREALADGGLMTFEELEAARRVWPDDENGAQVLIDLAAEFEAIKNSPDLDVLPNYASGSRTPLGYGLRSEQMEAIAAELERLEPMLKGIDRLLEFKGGRFPLVIMPLALNTSLSNSRPVRVAVKLKAAQAHYRALRGDTSHIVNDLTIIRNGGLLLADDPLLISGLVLVACDDVAVELIEQSLSLNTLSIEQLQQIDELLAGMEGEDRLSWALRGERACFIGTADAILAGRANYPGPMPRVTIMIPGARGFLEQDVSIGLNAFNRLVAAAKDPLKARAIAQEVDGEIGRLPPYRMITRLLMPSLIRVFELDRNLEGRLRACRASLAAERYRLDTGRFPAALTDLVPKYLTSVPSDPYDGRPLRYLADDRGVVVYSIGDNEADDGGQVAARVSKGQRMLDQGIALLPPERRGLPSTQPADGSESDEPVETPEQKAERLRRFREGGRY